MPMPRTRQNVMANETPEEFADSMRAGLRFLAEEARVAGFQVTAEIIDYAVLSLGWVQDRHRQN